MNLDFASHIYGCAGGRCIEFYAPESAVFERGRSPIFYQFYNIVYQTVGVFGAQVPRRIYVAVHAHLDAFFIESEIVSIHIRGVTDYDWIIVPVSPQIFGKCRKHPIVGVSRGRLRIGYILFDAYNYQIVKVGDYAL